MTMFGGPDFSDAFDRSMASSAQSSANSAAREARSTQDRLERLLLVNMALWSLLQDKTGLTEQDLIERVKIIDEMDGQADGKASNAAPTKCHACGRTVAARQTKCMYCGAPRRVGSAFEMV